MKKILSSQWRLSGYALLVFIGGVIGSQLVNPSWVYAAGALTGSLILVVINVIQVLYKKISKEGR